MSITVESLFLHPIKSLRGVSVQTAEVTPRGFVHDRRFMLVDPDGRFVTQREIPELARLQVELRDDHVTIRSESGSIDVDLADPGRRDLEVVVWRNTVWASHVADAIDAWFTAEIGRPLRLVRLPEDVHRPVNPERVPEGGSVSFADGYPYLVVTRAAIDDLARRLGREVDVRSFRPNLVVDGADAHAEDDWPSFEIGAMRFRSVKPCERCVMVTQDPWTGAGSKDVMTTLATYRQRDGKVLFGQNLMVTGEGTVSVGDSVLVSSVDVASSPNHC